MAVETEATLALSVASSLMLMEQVQGEVSQEVLRRFSRGVELGLARGHRRALAYLEEYPEAWSNLGTALGQQGKVGEAIEAYRRALAYREEFPEAWSNLGVALRQQGKVDEAIKGLRACS